jgi:hypothetical protein
LDLIFELSIRARGCETPHIEAGHTVELDRIANDQRREIRLHSRGRPHTRRSDLDLIFELSIRARGSETPHTEAGHTVELDRIAYDQRRKIRLHSRGRPHTGYPATFDTLL